MKKNIFLLLLFVTLNFASPDSNVSKSLNAAQPPKGFVITVTAANAGQGKLYISRRVNGVWKSLDSAPVNSKPLVLKGNLNAPEILYLRIDQLNTTVPVFCENSDIKVFADFKDPSKTIVTGSAIHDEYLTYSRGLDEFNKSRKSLMDEYKKAQQSNDQQKLTSLRMQFNDIDAKKSEYNTSYVRSNPASFVSPLIIRNEMFYTLQLEELKNLVQSLDPSLNNSVYVKDLKDKITVLEKVDIGKMFTDIQLPDPKGKPMKLSDYTNGKVILVDFWASWCGPCRAENPNIVKLYKDYHSKGFDIVGVSLDSEKSKWLEAIKKDRLTWHHMSDLKGWGSAGADLYGVSSIPHTVLLDKDGKIIAKKLRGEELRAKVEELLK